MWFVSLQFPNPRLFLFYAIVIIASGFGNVDDCYFFNVVVVCNEVFSNGCICILELYIKKCVLKRVVMLFDVCLTLCGEFSTVN